jgi:uncharacterized protein (AIM24 family)
MSVEQALAQFKETEGGESFRLQNSSGLSTSIKTDVNLKTFIGRGSGETIQMSFSGSGWLLIQPSEGRVAGGGSAGGKGALGNLLGGG